jgi:hypothetical protein
MRFSSRCASFLLLLLLGLLSEGCRVGGQTVPTIPATWPAVVTAVAPVGPVSPTKTVPVRTVTAASTVPAGPVVWTLTILHTGEVYGEVLPCG